MILGLLLALNCWSCTDAAFIYGFLNESHIYYTAARRTDGTGKVIHIHPYIHIYPVLGQGKYVSHFINGLPAFGDFQSKARVRKIYRV